MGGAVTCFQSGAQEWRDAVVIQNRGPCNRGNIPGERTRIMAQGNMGAGELPTGAGHVAGDSRSENRTVGNQLEISRAIGTSV